VRGVCCRGEGQKGENKHVLLRVKRKSEEMTAMENSNPRDNRNAEKAHAAGD